MVISATQAVTNLWSDLDTSWNFGPALTSTTQCFYCYAYTSDGYSNYQAMVVTLQKRYSAGLTVNANFTYSHALGIVSTGQSYTLDNASNAFNLYSDYGPEFFDRKFTFNLLSTYQLPFGKGKRWGNNANPVLSRIISGWTISPVFTYGTGLPLTITTGSGQEQGQAFDANHQRDRYTGRRQGQLDWQFDTNFGVVGTGNIGANGTPANGGANESTSSRIRRQFMPNSGRSSSASTHGPAAPASFAGSRATTWTSGSPRTPGSPSESAHSSSSRHST